MKQHKTRRIMPALALAGAAVIASHAGRAQQAPAVPANQPTCEEHRFAVTVGSRATEATARTCLNPDGSLEVVQRTPGLPVQSFHMSAAEVECGGAGQSACGGAPPQIDAQGCRSASLAVTIDKARRTATRRACPQADGSWQVTQTVPGLPAQSYIIPANVVSADSTPQPPQPYAVPGYYPSADAYPCYPYYPYYPCYPAYAYGWGYDPWFFGPPFFFGSVAIAFDNFHRSHRFDHFHDGGHAHFSHARGGTHFTGSGTGSFNGGSRQFSGGGHSFGGSGHNFSGGGRSFTGGGHFSGGGGGHFGGGGRR